MRSTPHVLFDATAVPSNRGGVGRYVDELLPALTRLEVPLTVACRVADAEHFTARVPGARIVPAPAAVRRAPVRFAWEQTGLPAVARAVGADVVHSPHYTVPLLSPVPVVVTLHDATFFTLPGLHLPVKRTFFQAWTRLSLRRATRCITPSAATRDELVRVAGARPGRVDVAHLGVNTQYFHVPSDGERRAVREYIRVAGPYIAFLGTLEPRKNVPALIRAWSKMAGPPALVLAGGRGWDVDVGSAVEGVPPGHDLRRPGYLPLGLLAAFLGEAELVAYPSLGEGFGLPVLEAMASEAVVLTTRLLSLPEVGGDAVAYTDPDPDAIRRSLVELLDDAPRRAGLRVRGRVRAASFTWDACARAHVDSYREAVA